VNLIIGLLGILKAGGAYVPLDPGLPKVRIGAMLADANARILVTRTDLAEGLRDQLDEVVCLDADRQLLARECTDNLQTGVTDQNLVYVIFTSGSTGRPKGVAVEHRQLANYLNAIWLRLDVATGSSFACVSTIAADLGNTAVFPPLCKGGSLHLISEERATDPEALADYCRRRPIDCLKIVPSHLQALLSASCPLDILPRLRLVLGGEACPWSLIEMIKSLAPGCAILNHYGPTETTVGVATARIDGNHDGRSETVPLGRPIANAQVYILDERIREVPLTAVGEIYIGGEGVARGYINRAGSTAEKFVPNPFGRPGSRLYKTGDLARYLVDGRIEFLGRVDDQLKIHGYRIEPGEIEIALGGHPRVAASVVVAREDQPGDKQLVAYIVARDQGTIDASELRTFLNGKLPEYMTPSVFVPLECLPLTQNGKLDRRALPAPDRVRSVGGRDNVEPRNPVEATLAQIWTNVLGVEGIGIHDNFFEIGGDSILSIQIIARATQAGLRLSPRQLFQHQTIAGLAAVAEMQTAPEVRKTTSGSSSKSGDDVSYSPSDFPRAKLSQEDLNKVLARLSGSPPGK
jgi:amino acid adenylation domain-containing protein